MSAAVEALHPARREQQVAVGLRGVVERTPLMLDQRLSERFDARVWIKREDLQVVRSYKLRGAYNMIRARAAEASRAGVVCASAGNHAQGVAHACCRLQIPGRVYMPATTPGQKVRQVTLFGREWVETVLVGDTFDDAHAAALLDVERSGAVYVPPFDAPEIIEGQGTVGLEILGDADAPVVVLVLPVGGGGLAAGVGSVFHQLSPATRVIGVEPAGAPAMLRSLQAGRVVSLASLDKFVDGAAVRRVGDLTFTLCRQVLERVVTVDEGHVCATILRLYDEEAVVAEPAGALSIAALDQLADRIRGKNVVCVLSGGNSDITRTEEIKERALLHEGRKHYFIVRFPQRAGALREFLVNVLGPTDDIAHFEYKKKSNREKGPAMIGIELARPDDFEPLVGRMHAQGFVHEYLNDKPDLFQFLI